MPMSSHEAAAALSDIAHTQHRAAILRGYEQGAPHFILWGLIWVVGYSLTDARPAMAGLAWLVLDGLGISGSFLLGRAAAANVPSANPHYGRRFATLCITMFAFIVATYFIMQPNSAAQFGAFPALLMAAIYTVIGTWRGARWAVCGIVLGVCTVVGFALFKSHFMLWMAAAGGAVLLLTGLWLRRA